MKRYDHTDVKQAHDEGFEVQRNFAVGGWREVPPDWNADFAYRAIVHGECIYSKEIPEEVTQAVTASKALDMLGREATETDPNGKDSHEAGAKLDAGKNRLSLVLFGFARALQAVGEVGTMGAQKYTDNGWMSVPDGQKRYADAKLRHMLKEAAGEERDTDTQLLHAAHEAWNCLARLELMLRTGQ